MEFGMADRVWLKRDIAILLFRMDLILGVQTLVGKLQCGLITKSLARSQPVRLRRSSRTTNNQPPIAAMLPAKTPDAA